MLDSFSTPLSVAVIGASGAIGHAFCESLCQQDNVATVYACSRTEFDVSHGKIVPLTIDIESEASIKTAVEYVKKPLDLVIVASGILHQNALKPEKNIRELTRENFQTLFSINTIGPALIAKYFIPLLNHQQRAVFAALSARVGSISDNRLGGWYAYRASKAALNMILKNLALELTRRHPQNIVIGLHPGTVDSRLSQPFSGQVAKEKLFTPEYAVDCLLKVINQVQHEDSGKVFAWDGSVIEY